jgi:hypothetical protein
MVSRYGMAGRRAPGEEETPQASMVDPNTADRVFLHRITP